MQLFRKLARRWHTWFAWGTVEILIHREVQLNGVTGAYRYRYLEQTPTGETRSPWHYGRPPGWRPRPAILDMADALQEAWAETPERAQEIRETAEERRQRLRAEIEGPGATFKLEDHDDVRRMAERLAPLQKPEDGRPCFVGVDRSSGPDRTGFMVYDRNGTVLWRDGEPMPEHLRKRILDNITDHSLPMPLGYFPAALGPREGR